MKVIFFGLGSIGQRHAKIVKKIKGARVYAFRSRKGLMPNRISGVREVYDWEGVDEAMPDVAFITNPTYLHIGTAIKCAERGMDLFIEKPLGSSLHKLKKLLRIISRKHISTYVAYVLRFHPVIVKLKRYIEKYDFLHMRIMTSSLLANWRPRQNHYNGYSASKKMGGGVILDLSHEMDYVTYLLGDIKKITGRFEKRSSLTVDAEDYADILIDTETGPANIHIDFLSHINQRVIQIDFEGISVVGDLLNNTIEKYRNGKSVCRMDLDNGCADPYEKQINYFFANIKNTRMMNSAFEALPLFKKLIIFKKRGYFCE